ncbi:Hsp70 family protein [Histomonas meleagridis]|uniref:Hsp70 family protein n=1 Tax=Histomonas meleagridis TaxID=135588 RepID=UPI00355A696F|nr:Hsp70 family protein [Histomonas meleagridis]KAH0797433.1 Hsp70 family protein [Histomonas meleagridis]
MSDINALLAQLQASTSRSSYQQPQNGVAVQPQQSSLPQQAPQPAPAATNPLQQLLMNTQGGAAQQSGGTFFLPPPTAPPPPPSIGPGSFVEPPPPSASLLPGTFLPPPTSAPPPPPPSQSSPLAGLLNTQQSAPPPQAQSTSPLAGLLNTQQTAPPPPQPQPQSASPLASLLNKQQTAPPPPQPQQQSASPLAGLLNSQQSAPPPQPQTTSPLSNLLSTPSPTIAAPPQPQSTMKTKDLSRTNISFQEFSKKADFTSAGTVKFNPATDGTIQSVLNKSPAYSLIEIPEGEYNEELTILKPFYVRGNGKVKILGKGAGDVIAINGDYVVLENLHIKQIDTREGGGISIQGGYGKVINCEVESEVLSTIAVNGKANVEIINSKLSGSFNPCLHCSDECIVYCEHTKFKKSKTYGVYTCNNTTLYLDNCKVSKNAEGAYIIDHSNLYAKKSEFKKNENSGIGILTDGKALVQDCDVHDHKGSAGIFGANGSAFHIDKCNFTNNDIAAVKVSEGSILRSTNNVYKDSEQNCIVLVNDNGFAYCENDSFSGKCIAALVAFENGSVEAKGISIRDVDGAGLLCYDSGNLKVSDSMIDKTTGVAMQIRNQSHIEFENVSITNTQKVGALIVSEVSGYIKNCKFMYVNGAGAEIAEITDLLIEDCEFNNNTTGGLAIHDKNSFTIMNCKFCNNVIGCDISGENDSVKFDKCEFNNNTQIGIHTSANSSPNFSDCVVSGNGQIGLASTTSKVHLQGCDFNANQMAGLSFSDSCKAVLENCVIHDNKNFGLQVHTSNTHVKLIDCKILNHINTSSLICLNDAVVRCINCKFESSLHPHCEIREGGKVSMKKCDLSNTSKGIGIQVHDDGVFKINETVIHNEQKFGIMIGGKGKVKAKKSKILDCGSSGVYSQPGSFAQFEECEFINNGQTAFQVLGEVVLKDCKIADHSAYGVTIADSGSLKEENTQFGNNGQANIHHQ